MVAIPKHGSGKTTIFSFTKMAERIEIYRLFYICADKAMKRFRKVDFLWAKSWFRSLFLFLHFVPQNDTFRGSRKQRLPKTAILKARKAYQEKEAR